MCFRYVGVDAKLLRLKGRLEALRDQFEEIEMPGDHFPGDQGEFVKAGGELSLGRWGLQPGWAKDRNFGKKNAYNARAETVVEKPTFRNAFRHRRCLVPAAAFYERSEGRWFRMRPRQDEAFLIAGLWEPGEEEPTYTMVTTEPNHAIADVQDRMPVLLDEGLADVWLSQESSFEELRSLMVPCPPSWVTVEDAGPIERRKKAEATLFDIS